VTKQAQQGSVPPSKVEQAREEVEDTMAKMEQIRVSSYCCYLRRLAIGEDIVFVGVCVCVCVCVCVGLSVCRTFLP